MRSGPHRLLVLAVLAILTSSSLAAAVSRDREALVPDPDAAASSMDTQSAYVVGFHQAPPVQRGDAFHGATVLASTDLLNFARVHVHDHAAFAKGVLEDDRVSFFEPDPLALAAQLTPTDPLYAHQYATRPAATNMESAWGKTTGATSTKVCILDSGADLAHEDLVGITPYVWDDLSVGSSITIPPKVQTTPYDNFGHGTHVTGILAARMNNGKGIAGTAPGASFGIVKVLDGAGRGSWGSLALGILECMEQGSHIVTMSLGDSRSLSPLGLPVTIPNLPVMIVRPALQAFVSAGGLAIAAAGNLGQGEPPCMNCVFYPAAFPEVVAVTCSTKQNAWCGFSRAGPEAELIAPGELVVSTVPAKAQGPTCILCDASGYRALNGTSMSTPYVAGLAALVKSQNPTMNGFAMRAHLTNAANVRDLGLSQVQQGHGLIQGTAV